MRSTTVYLGPKHRQGDPRNARAALNRGSTRDATESSAHLKVSNFRCQCTPQVQCIERSKRTSQSTGRLFEWFCAARRVRFVPRGNASIRSGEPNTKHEPRHPLAHGNATIIFDRIAKLVTQGATPVVMVAFACISIQQAMIRIFTSTSDAIENAQA
ncbi:hypothetical protein AG1IA_06730 [Rhizoctonia solani AG-1 IA]|uniref:Uncharacterized protein n=1 Tax=Thanatephorus cucumeris (strain AG1-IA) TaxID=983506 RepID=L8WMR3_THACA|nr:hypothetical protein AG1IA_06730 [Rhizoctonia solani AG-1 IA]